jgi:hypothetical protein
MLSRWRWKLLRKRLLRRLVELAPEEIHLLTIVCVNRRFSGDESFLNNPNGFNDDANEKNEARPRL